MNVSGTGQTARDETFADDSSKKFRILVRTGGNQLSAAVSSCNLYTNHGLENLISRYCSRHKPRKDSRKYREKAGFFEKRTSGPDKVSR